jgi:GMP synthase (glutamine-hydrolysing)
VKSVTAIRFVHFEDLGSFEAVLGRHGYAVNYVDAAGDAVSGLEASAPDLLICLGGPIGAYEDNVYPAVASALKLIERRLAADRPLLGICLGAQIVARALGARVYPGGRKEIGWSALRLTEAGRGCFLRHLGPESTSVLHWHGDTFDLPRRATLLASSEIYAHQAFAVGRNVLGLQFHPEVTEAGLERWYIGHACEIAATPGVEVAALRAGAKLYAPALENSAAAFLAAWLNHIDVEGGDSKSGLQTEGAVSVR